MREFDEAALVAELDRLPPEGRVAFAALCCERLITFARRAGLDDIDDLDDATNRLWDRLISGSSDGRAASDLAVAEARAKDAASREDELAFVEEDLAATVAYALRSEATLDPQEAAWAGRRAFELLDEVEGWERDDRGAQGVRFSGPPTGESRTEFELAEQRTTLDLLGRGPRREQIEHLRWRSVQDVTEDPSWPLSS